MLGKDWNEASVEYLLTYVYSQELRYGGDRVYVSSRHVFILEFMYMYTRLLRVHVRVLSQPIWNTIILTYVYGQQLGYGRGRAHMYVGSGHVHTEVHVYAFT